MILYHGQLIIKTNHTRLFSEKNRPQPFHLFYFVLAIKEHTTEGRVMHIIITIIPG